MANLTITAANVGVGSTAVPLQAPLQAGEALTQGTTAYLNSADSKYYKTDANLSAAASGSATNAVFVLTPAATNGYFVGIQTGEVIVGATLAVGVTYAVSRTAGLICPIDDLITGDWVTPLGTASTTALLKLDIRPTGIQKA